PRQWITNAGAYISDQIRIHERWHVSLGTRYDQQAAHGFDALNPVTSPYVHQLAKGETSQLGLVFDFTRALSGYASWSQSYVPPTVTQVDENGKSGFPAERGVQREAGLKYETADHSLYT